MQDMEILNSKIQDIRHILDKHLQDGQILDNHLQDRGVSDSKISNRKLTKKSDPSITKQAKTLKTNIFELRLKNQTKTLLYQKPLHFLHFLTPHKTPPPPSLRAIGLETNLRGAMTGLGTLALIFPRYLLYFTIQFKYIPNSYCRRRRKRN